MLQKLFFFLLISNFLTIACNPDKSNLEIAMENEREGHITQAMHRYDLAIRENPKNKIALKRLGLILISNPESMGVGIHYLERALKMDIQDEELRKALFFSYLTTEHYEPLERILLYWKSTGQEKIHQDMEAVYNCEIKSSRLKNDAKIVSESPVISDFWKKRCLDKSSK